MAERLTLNEADVQEQFRVLVENLGWTGVAAADLEIAAADPDPEELEEENRDDEAGDHGLIR